MSAISVSTSTIVLNHPTPIKTIVLKQDLFQCIDHITEKSHLSLEVFESVLKNTPVSSLDKKTFLPPLSYLMKHMRNYSQIHWDVVECFLKNIKELNTKNEFTPFRTLSLYYRNDPCKANVQKNLSNLIKYALLEKKYFPQSWIQISYSEFSQYLGKIFTYQDYLQALDAEKKQFNLHNFFVNNIEKFTLLAQSIPFIKKNEIPKIVKDDPLIEIYKNSTHPAIENFRKTIETSK